jgi:subtilase family serine protease
VGLVRGFRARRRYRQMAARLAVLDRQDREAGAGQRHGLPLDLADPPGLRSATWRRGLRGSRPGDRRTRVAVVVAVGLLVVVALHYARPAPLIGRRCTSGNQVVVCPYTPAQLRAAYDIQPLLDQGIDGRGHTVVLYEQAQPRGHTSDIYRDLEAFDRRFNLPPVSLAVIPALDPAAVPDAADFEEVMDTEIVHAVAPGVHIQVLLADNRYPLRALRFAVANQLGDVISMSLGFGEQCASAASAGALHQITERAAAQGVSLVASSGDYGAVAPPCLLAATSADAAAGVLLPGADPLVTAVGGTRLVVQQPSGRYLGETAWNTPPRRGPGPPDADLTSPGAIGPDPFAGVPHSSASGGGFSRLFARPDFQARLPGIGVGRGVPDVAADADPSTSIATVIVSDGSPVLRGAGGTSAGAPLWAGLAALADQEAGRSLGPLNPTLYRIAVGPRRSTAFHDVTVGNNNATFPPRVIPGFSAGPGWDPVTGWGSPDAAVLVPLLAHGGATAG